MLFQVVHTLHCCLRLCGLLVVWHRVRGGHTSDHVTYLVVCCVVAGSGLTQQRNNVRTQQMKLARQACQQI
jgi:hypothetical protein